MWPFVATPPNFADTLVYGSFRIFEMIEAFLQKRKDNRRIKMLKRERDNEQIARQKAIDDLAHG